MEIYEPTSSGSHVSDTTTDNTTVKAQAPPAGARGMLVSVKTNAVYMTFDGSTPSSTNGLYFAAATMPVFLPLLPASGESVKWISSAAGGSVVDIVWLR